MARHQLGLALAMDCQRIICLAREIVPDLIALQHEAERAGARFHIISGARGLAGLITANDDLLALHEGLLADQEAARALIEPGHAVLVQPVDAGVAAGYERIDLNHAAAGALRIPGRLVEQLLELPADCDVPSALTRIALQAGIPRREVPTALREGARWRLVRGEAEAHVIEHDWLRFQMGEQHAPTPMTLLSRGLMTMLGPSLLHAGGGSMVVLLATFIALLMALGMGWLGLTIVGLFFTAFAGLLGRVAGSLRRVESASLSLPPPFFPLEKLSAWLVDIALVAVVVWSAPLAPWESFGHRLFPPLMLVLMLRLLPRNVDRALAPWIRDRIVVILLLATAVLLGFLLEGVQIAVLLLAVAAMLFPRRKPQLT